MTLDLQTGFWIGGVFLVTFLFMGWMYRARSGNTVLREVWVAMFANSHRPPAPAAHVTIVDHSTVGIRHARREAALWALTVVVVSVLLVVFLGVLPFGVTTGALLFSGAVTVVASISVAVLHRGSGALVATLASCLLVGCGVFVMAVGMRWYLEEGLDGRGPHGYLPEVIAVIGFGLWIGTRLVSRAFRARVTAARVAPHDSVEEAPVLLLRSFGDDQLEIAGDESTDTLIESLSFYRTVRFEEVIATALATEGGVIAIGEPAAERRLLGAARVYYDDDSWQDGLRGFADSAAAIGLVVGRTSALLWEIGQLMERGHLGKVLFVIPPILNEEFGKRWAVFAGTVGWGTNAELEFGDTWPLVVRFDPGGRPVLHVSSIRSASAYESALSQAMADVVGAPPLHAVSADVASTGHDVSGLTRTLGATGQTRDEGAAALGRDISDIVLMALGILGVRSDRTIQLVVSEAADSSFSLRPFRTRDAAALRWVTRRCDDPDVQRVPEAPRAMRVVMAWWGRIPCGVAIVSPSGEVGAVGVHYGLVRTGLRDRLHSEASSVVAAT